MSAPGRHRAGRPLTDRLSAVVLLALLPVLALVLLAATAHRRANHYVAVEPGPGTHASQPGAVTLTGSPSAASEPLGPGSPLLSPETPAPSATVTYTVRPGDNLTVIATWFHQNGYQKLYDANKAQIGSDPNLIHPGQVLVVSDG